MVQLHCTVQQKNKTATSEKQQSSLEAPNLLNLTNHVLEAHYKDQRCKPLLLLEQGSSVFTILGEWCQRSMHKSSDTSPNFLQLCSWHQISNTDCSFTSQSMQQKISMIWNSRRSIIHQEPCPIVAYYPPEVKCTADENWWKDKHYHSPCTSVIWSEFWSCSICSWRYMFLP